MPAFQEWYYEEGDMNTLPHNELYPVDSWTGIDVEGKPISHIFPNAILEINVKFVSGGKVSIKQNLPSKAQDNCFLKSGTK